jgi:RNA polymerase sigma-70 factor (ECF subfamily)
VSNSVLAIGEGKRMVKIERWWGDRCVVGAGEFDGTPAAEAALLRDAQAGDRAALDQLVTRHKRPLFALCYGLLGHAEDAEDAVQEAFLRALRALPHFRGEATLRTWLFRIAVNTCLNWKRDRSRDPAAHGAAPLDERHPAAALAAESPEVIALRHLQIIEALRALLPRHRAILLLKEREGWSMAEIATALGWKEKRVERELSRARQALAAWRDQDAAEGDPK